MWTFGAWLFVFAINLAVPLLFSSAIVEKHGTVGMLLAIAAFLVSGCFLCAYRRELALALIIGGVIVGLTQLFPLLHLLAGWIGLVVAKAVGLAEFNTDKAAPHLTGELGGFVVTLVTGGILIAAAACIGIAIRSIAARRRKHRAKNATAGFH